MDRACRSKKWQRASRRIDFSQRFANARLRLRRPLMKRFAVLPFLVAMFLSPAAHAQKSPTLEQFLSAPCPTELTAAPAKGRVAWVFNGLGARNLWVAGSGDGGYKSRQLTAYKDDDGQDLGQLAWSADGETIVYTRGGDLEFV